MGTVEAGTAAARPLTQVERVVAGLTERIDRGVLRTGERLPSIRAAALAFAVSKNTAVNAYERLVAAGRVESRPGSGFYVSGRRPVPPASPPPAALEAVDSVWLLREQLNRHYDVRVGDGRPPPAWMEGADIGQRLKPVRRTGASTESYGTPEGYLPLRQSLALLLAERAIHVAPGGLLLTLGANHALDLIIRQLVRPGDAVLVDSPGYYPLFGKLRLAGARMVGVRRTPDGPDLADLADKAAATGAAVFFTQSLAHNPTGCSLSLPAAHRLLQRAATLDLRIVESDPFADVLPAASPRLAALDQLERVVYVGTFAKTLSASLRSGFIAAEAGLVGRLRDLKMVTSVNSSGFVERVVHEHIESGRYRRHLRRLGGRIEAATLQGRQILAGLGLEVFGEPGGGYYMWCRLPDGLDLDAFSRRAAARSILIAPGSVFHPDGQAARPTMRVNVAYLGDPRFAAFVREELG
nr:PLP-dependent aminotransferase family protein [Methylobacterium crusticola]